MNNIREDSADKQTSSKWWIPIGVLVVIVPIMVLITLVLPPDAYTLLISGPLVLVQFILLVLSPLFVYYDRRYLTATSRWEPSELYYLMFLPVIGYVLAIMYLYNRHKYLGVPEIL